MYMSSFLFCFKETVSYQLDSIDKRLKAKQQQEQQLRAQQEQKLHSQQEQQLRAQQVFQQQPSQQQEPVTHSHAVEPVDTSYSQPSSQPSQSVSGKQLLGKSVSLIVFQSRQYFFWDIQVPH